MAAFERWQSESWSLWTTSGDSARIVNGSILLPYSPINHIGTGDAETQVISRWRFGQNYGTGNALHDETTTDNYAVIPGGVPAETSPHGLNCVSKNGYASVVLDSDFNYPQPGKKFYLSCWIKSHVTSYESGIGVIAGYYAQFQSNQVAYALFVDTDNNLKAMVNTTGGLVKVSPAGGDVQVDTNWHHLMFIVDEPSSTAHFIVDNQTGDGPSNINAPQELSGTKRFTIGSSEISGETNLGFAGYIDELVVGEATGTSDYEPNYRYVKQVFVSPVVDTERAGSLLSSVYSEYSKPNGSSLQLSFRADENSFLSDDSAIPWTGFTAPDQIVTGTYHDVETLGVFKKGRFHQLRLLLNPSSASSPAADDLQTSSPEVSILDLNTGVPNKLLSPADAAYYPGSILAQVVNFSGTKNIAKVSMNLTVVAHRYQRYIIGAGGAVSFQAANFQEHRDAWSFQPVLNWGENEWESSGLPIENTLHTESFTEVEDAVVNAPYLKYNISFPAGGIYDLWGYGFVEEGGLFWGLDGDTTDLRTVSLGTSESGWDGIPRWTKFGSIHFNEGGIHSFTVYLSQTRRVILDQWYFTNDPLFESKLDEVSGAYESPIPLSESPFMTVVRLRSLYEGELDSLGSPQGASVSVSSWLPSCDITASGKFNYEIRNSPTNPGVEFSDGLSIEFWQIGGSSKYFSAWNYYFNDSSVGKSYQSYNHGQSFELRE